MNGKIKTLIAVMTLCLISSSIAIVLYSVSSANIAKTESGSFTDKNVRTLTSAINMTAYEALTFSGITYTVGTTVYDRPIIVERHAFVYAVSLPELIVGNSYLVTLQITKVNGTVVDMGLISLEASS